MTTTLPLQQVHDDQELDDVQTRTVVVDPQTPDQARDDPPPIGESPGRAPTSPAATFAPIPNGLAPPGTPTTTTDQGEFGAQVANVSGVAGTPDQATVLAIPNQQPPVLVSRELAVLAERVHALEEFRKACANQHQALTDTKEHKDGQRRGQHLPADHPVAIQSASIVGDIKKIEDQFVKLLEREIKRSPLGPWIKGQKGLGPKTIARLLGAIGDPYWNDLHDRPRTVSELWSFCGYRPGQRLRKSERVNWSPEAKMRAHVVIEPIVKMIEKPCYSVKGDKNEYLYTVHVEGECTCSSYRVLWDQARDKYRDTVHLEDCVRCGPKGHPALAGSPRSAAHQMAMASRLVKKRILRDLWREAKRLHEPPGDQRPVGFQSPSAAGDPNSHSAQRALDVHRRHDGVGPNLPGDQASSDSQRTAVAGVPNVLPGHWQIDAHTRNAGESLT